MRTCHYVILGVERTASEADIKKSYRRKALEWHPDKNHHRIEEATKHFALIAEAYEVLMDPQERAWYDSHRDAILRGDERGDQSETVAGTTAADLLKFFSGSAYKGFKDTSNGFFTVYRNLFQKLAEEEREAAELAGGEGAHYPSFGGSASPYESSVGDDDVKQFYNAWLKFSTAKSFAWCDKYRLSEAPDRRVRRAMEKENKKLRDAARKEFNDTVLSLAAYVRKRDPRFAAYQEEQKQRQEAIQAEVKARAEREKEKLRTLAAEFQEQHWARPNDNEESDGDEEDGEEIEEDYEHEYECILCDKYFKSERAWKNHEKSKKHVKAVEDLRQEMLDDESALADGNMWPMDEQIQDDGDKIVQEDDGAVDDFEPVPVVIEEADVEIDSSPSFPALKSRKNKNKKKKTMNAVGSNLFAEENLEQLEQNELTDLLESVRLSTRPKGVSAASVLDNDDMDTPGSSAPLSRAESPERSEGSAAGTPKAKLSGKAKKKARQELAAQKALTCNVCHQEHKTRNELFAHIKETGHALAPGVSGFVSEEESSSGKGGKSKKGRRK